MKILVISDTHGKIDVACKIATKGKYDCIFHLGDVYPDGRRIEKETGIEVIGVVGNCDFSRKNEEKILVINGVKIKLIHGHNHRVKIGVDMLKEEITAQNLNIILFGHTHVAYEEYYRNALMLNPGSISLPRDGMPSYAVLEIDEKGNFFSKITRLNFLAML